MLWSLLTQNKFGRDINFHLIRECVAQSGDMKYCQLWLLAWRASFTDMIHWRLGRTQVLIISITWDAITHPCPNLSGSGLATPVFKSEFRVHADFCPSPKLCQERGYMFNKFPMWLIWFCFVETKNKLAFFGIKMKLTEVSLATYTLQWRHNEPDGSSNHRRIDCLLKRLFMRRSKKTSMLTVIGLCEGNPLLIASLLPNVIKAMSMFQYPVVRIRDIVRSCDVLSNFETHLICWVHNILAVRLPLPP